MPKPTVKGIKVEVDEKGLRDAVRQASAGPLLKAGQLVEGEAKRIMKKGGRATGPKGGKLQIPSAPGSPPHAQSGDLRASITTAITDQGFVVVGPTRMTWYGEIHEFGSRTHPKRPFMRPALANTKDKFPKFFARLNLSETKAGRRLNRKFRK